MRAKAVKTLYESIANFKPYLLEYSTGLKIILRITNGNNPEYA